MDRYEIATEKFKGLVLLTQEYREAIGEVREAVHKRFIEKANEWLDFLLIEFMPIFDENSVVDFQNRWKEIMANKLVIDFQDVDQAKTIPADLFAIISMKSAISTFRMPFSTTVMPGFQAFAAMFGYIPFATLSGMTNEEELARRRASAIRAAHFVTTNGLQAFYKQIEDPTSEMWAAAYYRD